MYSRYCQKASKGSEFTVAAERIEFISPLQTLGDDSSTLMEDGQNNVSFLSIPSFPYTTVLQ